MKKLVLLLILLSLNTLNADRVQDLERALVQQEQHVIELEKSAMEKDFEIERYKIIERERLLFSIPFTSVGISKDTATGMIIGGLLVIIL